MPIPFVHFMELQRNNAFTLGIGWFVYAMKAGAFIASEVFDTFELSKSARRELVRVFAHLSHDANERTQRVVRRAVPLESSAVEPAQEGAGS